MSFLLMSHNRFQYLVHKEEFKKKKAEEEKAKAANGNQGRDFGSMLTVNDASEVNRNKPKAVTIESIQAQQQAQQAQQQAQQAHMQNRLSQVPTAGANPAQLAQHAAQQNALAVAQAQQNQQQAMQNAQAQQQPQRRVPLPRVASQDQLQQQRAQQQPPNLGRQLQPTGAASNAPTPMSSSPQVPIQRLPATPRNVPGTPRPPGTPQPAKHPTPQANGQAMTPASTQPSPMLKSVSQTDEGQMQQLNGARA